jgi:acylphosphatase
MERKEIMVIVSGRVQMVMFRDFAQRKARKLGVVGAVQNRSDGTVSIVAQGKEETLQAYVEHLKKGPVLALVDDVAVDWRDPTETFSAFTIVF